MSRILTDYGEEYFIQNGLDSGTTAWSVGLYDDSTDAISDTDDVGEITTEPAGTAYARQTSTFSPSDEDGDANSLTEATINDSSLSFDTSDSSVSVDSWFLVINYQSSDGETTASDHLIATGALSQSYDLSSVDSLDISAGGVGVSVN